MSKVNESTTTLDMLSDVGSMNARGDEQKNILSLDEIERGRKIAELDTLTTANELKREELEGKRQDREQRKAFANRIFFFVGVYMLMVGVIVFMCGIQCGFSLSDTVLITLLGTTTANMIGIFVLVVKYLFKSE